MSIKNWVLLLTIFLSSCSMQRDKSSYVEDMMVPDKCLTACWLGLQPGITLERNTVYEILSNNYGKENVYYSNSGVSWRIDSSPVFSESGYVHMLGDQVGIITIIFQNNQIPIDDLVPVFGKPEVTVIRNKDEVGNFPPCGLWQLYYPEIGLSIMVDSTTDKDYVSMMYINEPYPASQTQISKEREFATKESIINWDEREKYCIHTQPASP